MKKAEAFLLIAEHLTGTPKKEIQIINYEMDANTGLMSGTIEIDGYREHIHEYHN